MQESGATVLFAIEGFTGHLEADDSLKEIGWPK
jgi:hypothetical protein